MKSEDQNTNGGHENRDNGGGGSFPKATLEQALKVPEAIEEANAGNPYPPIDTANAVEMSPGSSAFRTLLAASYRYGLTSGSYKSPRISMQETGRSAVAPRTPDDRDDALLAGALRPPTFMQLFGYYKGKKLPEARYMANTAVREFQVPQQQAARCVEIFLANMEFVGLVKDTKSGKWLAGEAGPAAIEVSRTETEDEEQPSEDAATNEDPITREPPVDERRRPRSNAIFVGARKGKARDQLAKTLDGLGIPYKLAEEEANMARPISRKVRDTMEACGAGILILTADEEYRDKDGEEVVWKPSENVVHELGAAAILYEDRIVVFKEESVQLAANYSGIGYIEFERDKLDAKVNDLLRELFAFKIIAVQVGAG